MILTPEERTKFIQYLEEDIRDDEAIIEQMIKIKVPANVLQVKRYWVQCAREVVARMKNVESTEVR